MAYSYEVHACSPSGYSYTVKDDSDRRGFVQRQRAVPVRAARVLFASTRRWRPIRRDVIKRRALYDYTSTRSSAVRGPWSVLVLVLRTESCIARQARPTATRPSIDKVDRRDLASLRCKVRAAVRLGRVLGDRRPSPW